MASLSDVADMVQNRLEEPIGGGAFWKRSTELYSGTAEALNEMLLLVGRPTQIANVPLNIAPNTPWQSMPKGMLCITNLQGSSSEVWKYTLQDLDYLQAAWGSDWENDIGDTVLHWAPVGFNKFVVHPSVRNTQQMLVTGIAYPVATAWPYDGTQSVPFGDEFLSAIEDYAAHYARFKEMGNEFSESFKMYESFMQTAKLMTVIQDRRDPYLFDRATGAPMQTNPISMR